MPSEHNNDWLRPARRKTAQPLTVDMNDLIRDRVRGPLVGQDATEPTDAGAGQNASDVPVVDMNDLIRKRLNRL